LPPEAPAVVKDECGACLGVPWRGDSMEYLLWWMKGPHLSSGLPGALGLPNSSLGGSQLDTAEHSGGRFTLGFALDPEDQHMGIEGTYLFLGTRTANADF